MSELEREAKTFKARASAAKAEAAQRAALQLLCGVDLDKALSDESMSREAIGQRIERALKAERIKGLQRHWSYDLNRHIALKQARDRLRKK